MAQSGNVEQEVVTARMPYEPLARRVIQFSVMVYGYGLYQMVSSWLVRPGLTVAGYVLWSLVICLWARLTYVWGFRVSIWSELHPSGALKYRAAFRSGEVAVASVRYIRSANVLRLRGTHRIVHSRGTIRLLGVTDFDALVAAITRQSAQVGVHMSASYLALDQWNKRLEGTWWFRMVPWGRSPPDRKKGASGH